MRVYALRNGKNGGKYSIPILGDIGWRTGFDNKVLPRQSTIICQIGNILSDWHYSEIACEREIIIPGKRNAPEKYINA